MRIRKRKSSQHNQQNDHFFRNSNDGSGISPIKPVHSTSHKRFAHTGHAPIHTVIDRCLPLVSARRAFDSSHDFRNCLDTE